MKPARWWLVEEPQGCANASWVSLWSYQPHTALDPVPVPEETYLKEVIPLAGQYLALPPALEEPPELHEEQQEVVLELLGLLHQHVLLLAPEFLLQPALETQALQLKLPPQERPLLVLLQLRGEQEHEQPSRLPGHYPTPFQAFDKGSEENLGGVCW